MISNYDLLISENKIFSQNGEDGVIAHILDKLNIKEGFFVEIGVQNGVECNTRTLLDNGWKGIMIDNNDKYISPVLHKTDGSYLNIQRKHITAENALAVLRMECWGVPTDLDLLSLDIDGDDYHVLKTILYGTSGDWPVLTPKIIICEYNSQLGPIDSLTIKYEPYFKWTGNFYQGASLMAFVNLLKDKYTLVYCESRGVNAFFVRNDLIEHHFELMAPSEVFNPCQFCCGPKHNNPEGVCGHSTQLSEGQAWVSV